MVAALWKAQTNVYKNHQKEDQDNQTFLDRYNNLIEVTESYGANIGSHPILLQTDEIYQKQLKDTNLTTKELQVGLENALDRCREKYLAYGVITCLDKKRYGKLIEDLDNSYTLKDNKYPQTMTDAYNQVLHYKMPYKPKERKPPPTNGTELPHATIVKE